MNLRINGREEIIEGEQLNVRELLARLGIEPVRVAVLVNGTIVRRAEWESAALAGGDTVEIVTMVGGG